MRQGGVCYVAHRLVSSSGEQIDSIFVPLPKKTLRRVRNSQKKPFLLNSENISEERVSTQRLASEMMEALAQTENTNFFHDRTLYLHLNLYVYENIFIASGNGTGATVEDSCHRSRLS